MRLRLQGGKLLAIDWDRKTIRFVQFKPRKDGIDLLKAVAVPISPDIAVEDPAVFGNFLRSAMRQAGLSGTRTLLSISREQVVLNTLNLPPTPEEEMPAVVAFQIVKELPFPADQAALDFAVSGKHDPASPCNVLVAAVRLEDFNYYRAVADSAGLVVERIGLRPFSNLIAVTDRVPELAVKNLLVIEVGPQLTEIDIIRQGELRFSRSATVVLPIYGEGSGDSFKDSRIISTAVHEREPDVAAQESVSALMVDIIRSFEAYRATDPSVSLDHIIVCGSSGIEAHLAQVLASRFATRAELFSPERSLSLPPQRARELRGFSAALGLAIGHSRTGLEYIDFQHPKKPISRRTMQLRRVPIAAVTILLFVGSAVTSYWRFVMPRQEQVAALESELAEKEKEEEVILAFKSQVDAFEAWVESEQRWPEVLANASEVFPVETEAYATRADFEMLPRPKSVARDGSMKLRFRTASLGKVNEISSKLREAGFLNVRPGKEVSSDSQQDGYRYDSSIDAFIPQAKRASSSARNGEAKPKPSSPPEPAKPASTQTAANEGGPQK